MDQYVKEETLSGLNQYMCQHCNSKQDAKRCISLCQFPEVLNLQLLRFDYDMQTGKKKKLKTNIRCPRVLDMKPFVTEKVNDIPTYELSGILIHKGVGANGGHYIAHLRDEANSQWWIFDDTSVKQIQNEQLEQSFAALDNDQETATESKKKNKKKSEASKNSYRKNDIHVMFRRIGSCNAYMLIYTKIKREIVQQPRASDALVAVVQEETNAALAEIKMYEDQKIAEEKRQKEKAEQREQILSMIHPNSLEVSTHHYVSCSQLKEEFFWIYSDWLIDWINGKDLPQIDNSPLLCSHNKVDPRKIDKMKRISKVQHRHSKACLTLLK